MRDRLRVVPVIALLLLGGCVEPTHRTSTWTVLDLPASAEVYTTAKKDAPILLEQIEAATRSVETIMAFDHPGSELDRLNREANERYYSVESRDLYRAVRLGLDYADASGGVFDPTIGPLTRLYSSDPSALPGDDSIEEALERVGWAEVTTEREALAIHFRRKGMLIDLSGLIEGYALDVAARKFARPGSRAGLLRLGGHAYAWGSPPEEEAWVIPVRDPRSPEKPFVELSLASRALASEASGRTGRPILDPRTGRPAASDVVAAVVVADSAADAGAMVRALIVGGSRMSGSLLSRTNRVEAILLVAGSEGPSVLASASLQGRMRLSSDLGEEVPDGARYLLPPAGF